MKWLERVVGCDGEGRIYFGSVSPKISVSQVESVHRTPSGYDIWATPRRGSPDFWVYRPAAKPANCPVVRLFPVEHPPIMDRSNRIWFCPTVASEFAVPSAAGTLMNSHPAQLGRAELAAATQRLTNITVLSTPTPRIFGAAEISAHLDLFCYEQGRVSRCLTNLPLGTVLLASEPGGVIGTTQDRLDRGAFVVQDPESATVASDLHELALKSFVLMTNVAPRQSDPPGFIFVNHVIHLSDYCPSLCLVGDRLWINDHDKVEVYQNGKPAGYQMKLTIPSRKLCLFGPVTNSIGDQRMLIFAPAVAEGPSSTARAALVWTAASGDGELLGVDHVTAKSDWDTLLFNHGRNTFHLSQVVDRSWEISGPKELKVLDHVGEPVLALRNGDWIGRGAGYAGYRLVSGAQLSDITAACSRPLMILSEVEPGRILCATPEGLLWLARGRSGKFEVSEELRLHTGGFVCSFVGQDLNHLYLTLSDARRQVYLAIVEKQSQPR